MRRRVHPSQPCPTAQNCLNENLLHACRNPVPARIPPLEGRLAVEGAGRCSGLQDNDEQGYLRRALIDADLVRKDHLTFIANAGSLDSVLVLQSLPLPESQKSTTKFHALVCAPSLCQQGQTPEVMLNNN